MTYNDLRKQDYSFPSSDPLLFTLEIFKIQDIFKIETSQFIYKCLDKNIPINFYNWFTLTTHIHYYNTRSKFIIRDQLINTKNLFIHTACTSHGLKKLKFKGLKYGMSCHLRQ